MNVQAAFDDVAKAEQDIKEFAYYLGGLNDAWRFSGLPDWVDAEEFARHAFTAHEIRGGGTYRGPFVILAMAEYVDRLVGELEQRGATMALQDPNHG